MKNQIVVVIGILLLGFTSQANITVQNTRSFTDPKLGITVADGTLSLPAEGCWSLILNNGNPNLLQTQLVPSREARANNRGERERKAELQDKIKTEGSQLTALFWICRDYAKTNNNIGPAAWNTIDTSAISNHYGPTFIRDKALNYFLLPSVPIQRAVSQGGGTAERQPLAVQRSPLVADNKHWVLFNNGQSERVTIDNALCEKHGFEIEPQPAVEAEPPKTSPGMLGYNISALIKPGAKTPPAQLILTNRVTGARMTCDWAFDVAAAGDRSVLSQWAMARAANWWIYAGEGDSPILNYWLSRCSALYGTNASGYRGGRQRNRGENADAFSVLGGRAAIRETLQMQSLQHAADAKGAPSVALETLAGVNVKSHPFDDMLKGVQPGNLALAENVPADRAFVFFPKPAALLPLLNGGADYVFQGASLALANSAAYDLKQRYVEKLALSEQWVRDLLIKSGAVTEMAVLFPDLFFIDGTEVTVLARIPSARLLKPALNTLGLANLTDTVQEKAGKAGPSFWVMDRDLLVISTSRSEAERILAIRRAKGVGSLGLSAEFRYMLSQTPVRPETRCYCYLSDPFIRRLVGPEVKIGQLRRLLAKVEMENVTSAALLHRLDGQAGKPDIPSLMANGYLAAEPSSARDGVLDDQLVTSCPQYGSPAQMKTLLANPVTTATPSEVAAYKAYVENYSRFWRRYFDPIAFRLDDGPAGELQLTTLILPLIDNTIYNGIKEVVRHKEDGTPLRLPTLTPKPLMLLSLNLSEDSWVKATRGMFTDVLRRYTMLDPTAFDKIGPGVHLAIHDADPIITFGAGDTLGIFGAQTLGGGRQETFLIPVIASILTRPCQVLVELQDPAAIRRMLLTAAGPAGTRRGRGDAEVNFYRMEGRDAWICAFSVARMVNIRFGVELKGDYLILSNLPWSQKPTFGPTRTADLNALALDIHPESGAQQMPGLFTAACERERDIAVQGECYLYPFLTCGAGSVAKAMSQSRALFGFAPEHPGNGQWSWENGLVRSTVYGDPQHPVQPEYKPGDRPFGLMAGLDTLNLNLQFEDAGLRVVTRWKMKE